MSKAVQVPDGWKPAKLKNAAQVNPRSNSVDDDSLVTFLPMTAVSESGIIQGAEIRKAIDVKKGFTSFETGDVLVAKITPCFENYKGCLCTELKNDRGYGSTEFHVLRPKKNITGEYLHILTRTHHFRGTGKLNMTGTAGQKRVPTIFLKNYDFHLPPLPEQKAIADLLSTWDEAIEKTERLIQAKEKQLRQMSRWLLFGHKRLGNQKNELADGHFFEYPSDWALVKIGKVAKEVSARNGESEETVLSCSKYDGFVNSLDYFGKQVFSSDTSNYKVVKKGQFGYPSNHVEEGSIGLLQHCEKGIVSPIYVVFEASKEKVHSPYLYKLLKTDIYRHIFQVSTSSSVDRRGSLRWGDFSKIKVLVPSLEEQREISVTLSSAQHEINLLKQLADKYKTQKRGLMQKMLTGEWRVKPEVVNQYSEA